jgi:hypothetical protein
MDPRRLFGIASDQLSIELLAVHIRHADVGQHEIETRGIKPIQRRSPAVGNLHPAAERSQDLGQHLSDLRLVVDNQDQLCGVKCLIGDQRLWEDGDQVPSGAGQLADREKRRIGVVLDHDLLGLMTLRELEDPLEMGITGLGDRERTALRLDRFREARMRDQVSVGREQDIVGALEIAAQRPFDQVAQQDVVAGWARSPRPSSR